MKKELAAAGLLLTILLVSLWNTRHLRLLLDDLQDRTTLSLSAAESGQWETASAASEALALRWENAEAYTQVFIRHPDIEAMSDALTSLCGAVRSQDADAVFTAAMSVSTRLEAIRKSETLSPGSIF